MGAIFGGGDNQPTRLFQARVNQSVYGLPYPVVMGTAQVQQSILWIDNFVPTKQSSKTGGKGGGGKGGTFYTYTADVVSALCNGPITAIGDVWSGQSWLGNPTAAESYTITGSGVYTPTNASSLTQDLGASFQTSYSGSYNDFGSPTTTVLTGTGAAVLVSVAYGSQINSGQYAVNPITGNYYFNTTTDSGKTVNISYSYSLTTFNQQENDVIPSGKTIAVGGSLKLVSDLGVQYATGANEGVALTRVSGTPTVTGTYQVTGSGPATYHFAPGDIGAEVTITFSLNDPNAVGQGQATTLNFTLNNGALGQSPFSFLTASYPGAAFGYTGLATVLYQPMALGASAEIQENKFEVITPDVYGGGIEDCNPVTCITKVLTNGQWGLGVGPIPFPTSALDNGASGTWGGPGTAGTWATGSTAWNWFTANNFFISPVIDTQDTAASVMSKWLEAGMCAAFMSEGLLKLVPYGDTSTAANGCTWVAPSNFVVALDDTCFVPGKEGEDPVKITRVAAHDVWNVTQVQWDNRKNQYSPEITQESDQSLINRWGERREDAQDWSFIHTLPAATFAANMRLKHGSYVRNTYEFTLPFIYSYLEPMDIVTISTTSIWAAGLNNANLGVVNLPVRIIKIVDDPVKGLEITAESYPFGANQPTIYNKQISNGDVVANAFADPGSAEIVMFEATSRMTGYSGNEIWIGANGAGAFYGQTNVWVSQDQTTYLQIGSIKAPARMGTLASTFASGSDPDTVNSLVVNLVENCAALEAGTTTDADYGNTQCFVDGEIISYSTLVASGQNQITMSSYIRRGQMNSTIGSHAAGSLFMRLDNAIYKYQYDPTWAGKTLYFKFQAVNAFGNNAQPLSSLTAVAFTVPGLNPGTIDASSGIVTANHVTYTGGSTVDSLKPAQVGADVTSLNTAADTAKVNTVLVSTLVSASSSLFKGSTFLSSNNSRQTSNSVGGTTSGTSYTQVGTVAMVFASNISTYFGTLTLTRTASGSENFTGSASTASGSGWSLSSGHLPASYTGASTTTLTVGGFGISIPAGVTITDVQIQFSNSYSGTGTGYYSSGVVFHNNSQDLGSGYTPATIGSLSTSISGFALPGGSSGTFTVSGATATVYTDGGTFTGQARIRIGTNNGTEVDLSGAGPTTGTSTITSPASGAQTVIVEAAVTSGHGGTIQALFTQVDALPSAGSQFS
jgi:hypothetical protein